ncbi:MAG: hypothetical protein LIP15_04080 [Clostridium sp.]|nr:hypothetical protein [Clostridium sp.]
MIKLENTEVTGWEAAIRGMRNPKNSWSKSDSQVCSVARISERSICSGCESEEMADVSSCYIIGPNDHKLMMNLAAGGPVHAKYRRMIVVYVDITAPFYWWKEFDTYKVGTVANSCSTMHKIADKEFELNDFSYEHLVNVPLIPSENNTGHPEQLNMQALNMLEITIGVLNAARYNYLKTKDKTYWWQMIQLLPSSYNQKRTIMLNYEVLAGIYPMRKNHKLDEWHDFCNWIEWLPYSEIIIGDQV